MTGENTNTDEDTIQISEELEKIFDGSDLSEDFKEKTSTLFETAVNQKAKSLSEEKEQELKEQYDQQLEEEKQALEERVNDYLNFVIEDWTSNNQLAIESGVKLQMYENFVTKLREAFEEMNVEIPEGKEDLVDKHEQKINELEDKLNERINESIDLKKENEKLKRNQVVESVGSDLTETQREKFSTLIEDIEFTDEENFEKKAKIIAEQYFDVEDTSDGGKGKGRGKQQLDEGEGADTDEFFTEDKDETNPDDDSEELEEDLPDELKGTLDFMDRHNRDW